MEATEDKNYKEIKKILIELERKNYVLSNQVFSRLEKKN